MPGALHIDTPADGVLRLTISNPAKRNALDHTILDGIAHAVRDADARCIVLTGATGCSARATTSATSRRTCSPRRPRSSSPTPSPARSTRSTPPTCRRSPRSRPHDRRRSGAGARLRPAHRGRRHQARHAAREARARLLAHGAAALHRHGRRRAHARAVPAGPQHPRAPRARLGPGQRGRRGSDLDEAALDWASELAATRRSRSGNKRVIRELLRAKGELDPDVEAELIALREACFASEDMKEGVRAFGEKRPARWQGR